MEIVADETTLSSSVEFRSRESFQMQGNPPGFLLLCTRAESSFQGLRRSRFHETQEFYQNTSEFLTRIPIPIQVEIFTKEHAFFFSSFFFFFKEQALQYTTNPRTERCGTKKNFLWAKIIFLGATYKKNYKFFFIKE